MASPKFKVKYVAKKKKRISSFIPSCKAHMFSLQVTTSLRARYNRALSFGALWRWSPRTSTTPTKAKHTRPMQPGDVRQRPASDYMITTHPRARQPRPHGAAVSNLWSPFQMSCFADPLISHVQLTDGPPAEMTACGRPPDRRNHATGAIRERVPYKSNTQLFASRVSAEVMSGAWADKEVGIISSLVTALQSKVGEVGQLRPGTDVDCAFPSVSSRSRMSWVGEERVLDDPVCEFIGEYC